jgi:hypothetical protein
MDAVHLARALTGRDLIIKVEGCYHGHHDSVLVSVLPDADEIGPRDHPIGVPGNSGIPAAIRDLVVVVPFNDVDAVARALTEHRGRVAAMILEPVMMNAGIIPPHDGYLAAIRDLVHRAGALLIFDEVKTGFTTGPGGVTASSGVVPDMVCLAKALGGGISVAAIGGTTEVMSAISDGRYEQVGTFNGNPLAMAATRATLAEVLTPESYRRLDANGARLRAALEGVIAEHGYDWHVVSIGAKGCVTFRRDTVREFRDFLHIDARLGPLHWLVQHNGGVIPPACGGERSDPGIKSGGQIRLVELVKSFDGVPAVTGIDLDIPAGQFYSLLGASGCGKTTTLRMIAGFEKPDSGRIELDGRDVAGDPPHRRPVNTVFQTYALFPSTWCKWASSPSAVRLSCRAASSSASRWPAPWYCGRVCSFSTNHSARWIPSCASSYSSNCAPSSARWASRSCT